MPMKECKILKKEKNVITKLCNSKKIWNYANFHDRFNTHMTWNFLRKCHLFFLVSLFTHTYRSQVIKCTVWLVFFFMFDINNETKYNFDTLSLWLSNLWIKTIFYFSHSLQNKFTCLPLDTTFWSFSLPYGAICRQVWLYLYYIIC